MVWLRDRLTRGRRARELDRVPDRVAALAGFVELAGAYLPPSIMDPARGVVERAGRRLTLSGTHTVVALAGTTGSGKSSLFNALAGTPLSPAGLRRPTTGMAHAVVFTEPDATPEDDDTQALLDWLGIDVRYRQAGAAELDGLVLLDLPDIDSVERSHGVEADRLLELVDLVVWVLDPQKYADLTVHRRYRETFRNHGDITVVALNQADRLRPEDLRRCLDDLTAILREDGLVAVPVIATSAVDGPSLNALAARPGIDDLRDILERTVAARVASLHRLAADVNTTIEPLEPVMEPLPAELGRTAAPLADALAVAAGVPTVTRAARQSYVYRAVGHTGWPITRWLRRLRGDPLRRLRLTGPAPGATVGATAIPPPSPAATARVALATRSLGEQAGRGLHPPWPDIFHDAARSRADEVADALDVAVARTDLRARYTPPWWRLIGVVQLLFLGAALAGLVWLGVRWVLFALALPTPPSPELGRLPLPTLLLGGGLLAGLVLGALARVAVGIAARRHAARTERALTRSVAVVADDLVLTPLVRLRDDYLAARANLAEAARRT
jgi:energy-coupling factor transporter ATP-binding protein EcfA2